MDKRTLIVMFIVVMLFMILNTYVFNRNQNQQPASAATADSTLDAEATAADSATAPAAVATTADPRFQAADSSGTFTLKNDLVSIGFSSQGAAITSVQPLTFKWADKETQVELVPEDSRLAMIKLQGKQKHPDIANLNWNAKQSDPKSLIFWLGEESNPAVTKTFTLDEKYGLMLNVAVSDSISTDGILYDFSAGIADSEKVKEASKTSDYKVLYLADNHLEKITMGKIAKKSPAETLKNFSWAAMRTKYFTIALCDTSGTNSMYYKTSANPATKNPALMLKSPAQGKGGFNEDILIYAGPADHDLMKKEYPGTKLEYVPDRGASWYRWLSNIIAWLLKFLHSFLPNYGVVIIIFSIILKVVLHPLTHKSMDANLKMQRIQPQVQEIQKKYKNDPKTMQLELSKLYKEAGASPLSGCLPLLLQMPIFFALYAVLRYTLDMRNASFMGWLSDLSEPDPLLILPIIMAGFMILQSLMMRPKKEIIDQMDEKQKAMQQSTKMMTWVMPIMMFFIFKGLPSGLVLYYTVFNVLSVAQQYYLQKHLKQKGI